MFESVASTAVDASGAGGVEGWSRAESAACARKVAEMAEMFQAAHAADGSDERDLWCTDTWDAVAAHIGAVLRITPGAASNQLLIAVALHERFPQVAEVFAQGLITYAVVRTVVQRGALVVDPDALGALDAMLAEALRDREPMSVATLEKTIDAVVARVDPQAVIRTETRARGRSVEVGEDDGSGMATVLATLFATDAKAFDARLDALARTVCPADPRTVDQRRADAYGAMCHRNDRLACLCGTEDCTAADNPPATGVVVYVIASQETLDERPAPVPAPPAPKPTSDSGRDAVPDSDDTSDDTEGSDSANEAAAQRESTDISDSADDSTVPNQGLAQQESIDIPANPASDGERAALDGEPPAMFTKPLRELTLTEALTPAPGRLATLRPAALMGGQFLPGAIAGRATIGATITPIVHPGQAPPEPRYRPSKKLADFIRCRDLTCRFPGCRVPATHCDVDHGIPWPCGPTAASNLKCLCRRHHLLKTFWGGLKGWRDEQFDDGTVVWTAPDGRNHTTTPGSRLLFPELSAPTAAVTASGTPAAHSAGLTMPRRTTTREQDRARRVAAERELNRVPERDP